MPKVGIILGGCGVNDGSEIHESVLTMLALDRGGAEMLLMAPDIEQLHVINHFTGEAAEETRNVLVESARIARGEISDLSTVSAADIDALIIPGGFGVAKNLSDYAMAGKDCVVNPDVSRLVQEIYEQKKPIGAICIAPTVLSKIMNAMDVSPELTIGSDPATAQSIEDMGGKHVNCPVSEIIVDQEHNIVSTPAYMEAKSIKEAAAGIDKLVAEILKMAGGS